MPSPFKPFLEEKIDSQENLEATGATAKTHYTKQSK